MKYAFDIHGVLDKYEDYRELLRHLYKEHAIYIISGQPLDDEIKDFLIGNMLVNSYDHYFSIETELLKRGAPYEETENGKFFADEIWNPVKAEICAEHGINIMFDDTEVYAEYFKGTTFCLVK